MAGMLGYILLGAALVIFLYSLFDDTHRTIALKFAAIMLAVGGLTILQFVGTSAP